MFLIFRDIMILIPQLKIQQKNEVTSICMKWSGQSFLMTCNMINLKESFNDQWEDMGIDWEKHGSCDCVILLRFLRFHIIGP